MNQEIIPAEQIAGTPAENVKKYIIEGNIVHAEFWNASDAAKYMRKYATVNNGVNCINTKVAFADFEWTYGAKTVKGSSTYHPTHSIIKMFEAGLKNE